MQQHVRTLYRVHVLPQKKGFFRTPQSDQLLSKYCCASRMGRMDGIDLECEGSINDKTNITLPFPFGKQCLCAMPVSSSFTNVALLPSSMEYIQIDRLMRRQSWFFLSQILCIIPPFLNAAPANNNSNNNSSSSRNTGIGFACNRY